MSVFLCWLYTEDQTLDSTSKVRTFWGNENISVGPHNFQGLFEGSDLVWRLGLESGLCSGKGYGQGGGYKSTSCVYVCVWNQLGNFKTWLLSGYGTWTSRYIKMKILLVKLHFAFGCATARGWENLRRLGAVMTSNYQAPQFQIGTINHQYCCNCPSFPSSSRPQSKY